MDSQPIGRRLNPEEVVQALSVLRRLAERCESTLCAALMIDVQLAIASITEAAEFDGVEL